MAKRKKWKNDKKNNNNCHIHRNSMEKQLKRHDCYFFFLPMDGFHNFCCCCLSLSWNKNSFLFTFQLKNETFQGIALINVNNMLVSVFWLNLFVFFFFYSFRHVNFNWSAKWTIPNLKSNGNTEKNIQFDIQKGFFSSFLSSSIHL